MTLDEMFSRNDAVLAFHNYCTGKGVMAVKKLEFVYSVRQLYPKVFGKQGTPSRALGMDSLDMSNLVSAGIGDRFDSKLGLNFLQLPQNWNAPNLRQNEFAIDFHLNITEAHRKLACSHVWPILDGLWKEFTSTDAGKKFGSESLDLQAVVQQVMRSNPVPDAPAPKKDVPPDQQNRVLAAMAQPIPQKVLAALAEKRVLRRIDPPIPAPPERVRFVPAPVVRSSVVVAVASNLAGAGGSPRPIFPKEVTAIRQALQQVQQDLQRVQQDLRRIEAAYSPRLAEARKQGYC
jgi:hypothetical protein